MRKTLSASLLALAMLLPSARLLAAPSGYDQISLGSEVREELPMDRMQVVLYTEAQDKDPARLANQITETINQAIKRARQQNGVQVQLGNRSSYPLRDDRGRQLTGWSERAEIRLESADFPALSKLTGELLSSLQFASLGFSLSPEARSKAEDRLMDELIKRFGQRASHASKALGGKSYRLVSLDLNTDAQGIMPVARGMAMKSLSSASMATPEVEAGTTELVLRAAGVIEVQH